MAGKKLTDRQIKNIIAAKAEGETYSALARRYNVSVNTIKNYCNSDENFAKKCNQKKEENEKSVLKHMETKSKIVCEIVDKYLNALADPERLEQSGTREIATALGIIIDKFTKGGGEKDIGKIDEILGEINAAAKR